MIDGNESMTPPATADAQSARQTDLITIEQFEQMSFEFPVDLVKGRIEEMPPPGAAHGRVCGNIFFLLEGWARQSDAGTVTCNDSAVLVGEEPGTVRGSDVVFVRWESLPDRTLPAGAFRTAPELVVEVLSPSDQWSKFETKLDDYLAAGVQEIWVVSVDERCVWVYRPGQPHRRLGAADALTSSEVLPGFSCRVVDFFLHV
jgi:Uma2 family endonuclease